MMNVARILKVALSVQSALSRFPSGTLSVSTNAIVDWRARGEYWISRPKRPKTSKKSRKRGFQGEKRMMVRGVVAAEQTRATWSAAGMK